MAEQITIVGGGITGCMTALACQESGMEVTLYEMSSDIGGVMQDLVFDGQSYFNGCHYFDCGTPWFEALRARIDCRFEDFEHRFGSITELQGKMRLVEDYAQPVLSGTAPETTHSAKLDESLSSGYSVSDRLNVLGSETAQILKDWTSPYGDLDSFHISNARIMQLHRFYYPDDDASVRDRKSNDALADDMFGIPRSKQAGVASLPMASLPSNGYGEFFQRVRKLLEDCGVKIVVNAPVAPRRTEKGLELVVRGETVPSGKLVWCCNPTGLFMQLGLGKLDTPATMMYVFVADLPGTKIDVPAYYHLFSRSNPVMRLYIYNPTRPKLVVEAFDTPTHDQNDLETPARHAKHCLNALGLDGDIHPAGLVKQKRYQMFTTEDAKRFSAFDSIAENYDLIGGQWQQYSRDGKIENILKALNVSFE